MHKLLIALLTAAFAVGPVYAADTKEDKAAAEAKKEEKKEMKKEEKKVEKKEEVKKKKPKGGC